MVLTASTGYLPAAVSPESMMAEVPSKMALATSVISARVGRGCSIMESSIWVAVMTGLPQATHWAIICFCSTGISVKSISTPMSPRATMMPSATEIISERLLMPSWFSIFAIIRIFEPTLSSSRRISRTSAAVRTKLAAMKSKPCSAPKRMSSRSRWLM